MFGSVRFFAPIAAKALRSTNGLNIMKTDFLLVRELSSGKTPSAASYPAVKGTDFYHQKIRTVFQALDTNSDGALSVEDFKKIADGLIRENALTGVKADRVGELLNSMWTVMFKPASNEKISAKDFPARFLSAVNGPVKEHSDAIGCGQFEVMDMNGDGKISRTEYCNYMKYYHIDKVAASVMFDILDVDGDGQIDQNEFMKAFIDFCFSEDPKSPYKIYFGPLKK